jgi:hypothetical protein
LPDEVRLDINNDGTDDNAWYFKSDLNNDGTVGDDEVIAYSILIDDNNNGIDLNDDVDPAKAAALVTRNGPISTSEVTGDCAGAGDTGQRSAEGWQVVNGTTIEKNFQVNAFVANLNDVSRVASTLEFQQVRAAARSNKWGAWFRYDLSVSPGPRLNWNGAMHTQGSFLTKNNFRAYMISSTKSCLYDESASEITVGAENAANNFKGQFVFGNETGFDTGGGPRIHVDNGSANPTDIEFKDDRDSIASGTSTIDVMLDPVEVYLNDESTHVSTSSWTAAGINALFDGRVRNIGTAELRSISLDDTFRADNRWGPKKVYDAEDAATGQIPSGTSIGTNIGSISKLTNTSGGLDGYWERQAINLGARIMVGERLELGDVSGWNYDPVTDTTSVTPGDALYPPDAVAANNQSTNGKFGYGEQKQRKALRDNLAAVQGMVVYKYGANYDAGLAPRACIAVTAHPGTLQTQINSRTFRTLTTGTNVMTDFLTGNGTNGWEFEPVTTSSMSTPLQNLANFAGDPEGGAPTFAPVQDSAGGDVHPYPYMSMWGDFSVLRRTLDSGNGSPADETYKDTAACTLGLLAYNLAALKGEYDAITAGNWQDLATELTAAYTPGLEVQSYEDWQNAIATAAYRPWVEAGYRYWQIERDRSYGFLRNVGLPGVATAAFGGSYSDANAEYTPSGTGTIYTGSGYDVTCDPSIFADAKYGITNEDDAISLALATCPKKTEVSYPSLYYLFPVVAHDQDGGETISGITYGGVVAGTGTVTVDQPTTEPYIQFVVGASEYNQNGDFGPVVDYAAIAATPRSATGGSDWELDPGAASVDAAFTNNWGSDGSDPNLPDNDPFRVVVMGADGTTFTRAFAVLAIDKVVYNGRELMPLRLLDLNVGALASADWIPGKDASDVEHNGLVYAYREDAVREDEIVRPVSGTPTGCNTYATLKAYISGFAGCYMQHNPTGTPALANVLNATDPPLADNNISLKPMDYAPDPDRRPYGFRLRNGESLNRGADEQSGISFITDNVVAIQGDFNLHFDGTNPQEEFSDNDKQIFQLDPQSNDFYAKFYGRENLNLAKFANSSQDTWRPAEVLADAVYIYSAGFKDGFAEAAYVKDPQGTTGSPFENDTNDFTGLVSYQNRNPFGNTNDNQKRILGLNEVLREGRSGVTAPVYFDRNGVIYNNSGNPRSRLVQDDSNSTANYYYWGFANIAELGQSSLTSFRNDSMSIVSGETTVNSLIISGVVPPRLDQQAGGLANFPRFDEYWLGTNLNIAGGFFQLFFSTSATAPFDQDAWEFDQVSDGNRFINYYTPPNRVWGYDVALQYSPQSPIASRFTSVGDPRSEFYRELPVDDPYIKMLRCAEYTPGTQIDPNASCS